jgi:hypothetical protein
LCAANVATLVRTERSNAWSRHTFTNLPELFVLRCLDHKRVYRVRLVRLAISTDHTETACKLRARRLIP